MGIWVKPLTRRKKGFKIIGSAHNVIELKNKENQGCKEIAIAPIFNTKKNDYFLDVIKFNLIAKNAKHIIALGGINETNISILSCYFPLYEILDQIPSLQTFDSTNKNFKELSIFLT